MLLLVLSITTWFRPKMIATPLAVGLLHIIAGILFAIWAPHYKALCVLDIVIGMIDLGVAIYRRKGETND